MNTKMYLFNCVLIFSLVFSPLFTFGQSESNTSSVSTSAYQYTVNLYQSAMKRQAPLFNGGEYVRMKGKQSGNPFFEFNYFEDGDIIYDGEHYGDIPLMYDVVRDELITEHYDQQGRGAEIIVQKERVQRFTIANHLFIRLGQSSEESIPIPAGYYEVLYDGEVRVLAKRKKEIKETVDINGVQFSFRNIDKILIYKEGKYYYVKSKGSVMKVFQENKKELAQSFRNTGLRFNENREQAITEMARQFDHLTQSNE